jgi:deoxycytidylate deaminase
MATAEKRETGDESRLATDHIAPKYEDLVIGLVYYAGATIGTTFCADLQTKLAAYEYQTPDPIKVSSLIEHSSSGRIPEVTSGGRDKGRQELARTRALQDLGDEMRKANAAILSSLAIRKIRKVRQGPPGSGPKRAFIIDSLKHQAEVDLLRRVYGHNFRLIAIHCSRDNRFKRLEKNKYHLAPAREINDLIDRDEQYPDPNKDFGQQVNAVFHQADFFINNDHPDEGVKYEPDLKRFVELCVGGKLLRPRVEETGMYHAQASSLRSACLSRQVGAAILAKDGRVLAIGANEVPKPGGGVYCDEDSPDHRCFAWKDWCLDKDDRRWEHYYDESPVGEPHCHNTRRKHELREEIIEWFIERIAPDLAGRIGERVGGGNLFFLDKPEAALSAIKDFMKENRALFKSMPGIRDIIEYSRSIHAEMDALMSALRSGIPTTDAVLYTTTYPCHNCARHIVAAGISRVYYMEPFVKSLAVELHHDALVHDKAVAGDKRIPILPFTGVGPRLYTELFLKEGEWKTPTGRFDPPPMSRLRRAIPIDKLDDIEKRAAEMAPPVATGEQQR